MFKHFIDIICFDNLVVENDCIAIHTTNINNSSTYNSVGVEVNRLVDCRNALMLYEIINKNNNFFIYIVVITKKIKLFFIRYQIFLMHFYTRLYI